MRQPRRLNCLIVNRGERLFVLISRSKQCTKDKLFISQRSTWITQGKFRECSNFRGRFVHKISVGNYTPPPSQTRPTSRKPGRRDTMSKRSASPPTGQGTLIKRSRSSEPQNTAQLVISSSGKEREQALIRTVKRTSNLEAPIVSLSGAHGVGYHPLENAVILVANRRDREKF